MGVEVSTQGKTITDVAEQPRNIINIVVIGNKNGESCLAELAALPKCARILATGNTLAELTDNGCDISEGTVILNMTGSIETLPPILAQMPLLVWFHSCWAGMDKSLCKELVDNPNITVTNAKGVFSSSLAEYTIAACLHFSKDVPRLMSNKQEKKWDKFVVKELRGATMGVVGYGDIGQSCAMLGKAMGMKIIGVRRRVDLSDPNSIADKIYAMADLHEVMAQADYLVTALPLVKDTIGVFNAEAFAHSKSGQVFINIGRGQAVDEVALLEALTNGPLGGAACDVFCQEPLPSSSPLWNAPNLLISSHNADWTADMQNKSVQFFTDNCIRYANGEELQCVINKTLGY